ncbi:cAMP phosphodiesterase [Leuconostoc citreum]|uniref:cyclic nucleotide-binding domain-containing protein n=1 Tax=Leuconostoc citreum TaxID=33964 RepID=UPI0011246F8E|nr:cyclic nucleotide-binding domain-containing protein [Leuconostoc citreum]TOY70532.1 cAMP phosphodiesterase [Leuconostoc citreum]
MLDVKIIEDNQLQFLPSAVVNGSFLTHFKNGDIITTSESNNHTARLYYMVKGRAKVIFLSQEGQTNLVQFLKPNDWIGELEFLTTENTSKQVIAIGDTTCITIPNVLVNQYLVTNIDYLKNMNQYLTRKLLERTDMMIVGQSYPFKFRLASFILADTYRGEYSEPHAVVMAYLGISYRHLLNTYQQFETAQLLIKVGRNRYQVNTAKLKQLAGKAISR